MRTAALLVAVAATVVIIGGCAQGGVEVSSQGVQVVAAENMWGSVAAQIAGGGAQVHSIITNPAQDPHSYEPTAADARALAVARLVIVNGIGYDPWAGRLLAADPAAGRKLLDVGRLVGLGDGANPHRWYDPGDVVAVARAVAADLQALDPAHRSTYAQRLSDFETARLLPYHHWISLIARRYSGVPVGSSESIFALLSPALGLSLITPPSFMKAVSEGTEISAHDVATTTAQIVDHRIRVWVLNSQNATPEVSHLTDLARRHGIPVAPITETLTPSTASFEDWQVAQLRTLAGALHEATGR